MDKLYFSSGCDLLDNVLGGGVGLGIPSGRILNIVGDKSAGKTFLAHEFVADAYYRYGNKFNWKYDDAEFGNTFDSVSLYGFNITDDEHNIHSKTVQEWYCNLSDFIESVSIGHCGIYVIDSLDGLSSDQTEDRVKERINAHKKGKEFNQGSYQMDAAKFLSQEFFKTLTRQVAQKEILLIVVSQTRDKINSLFHEQTRSGGKALDFYCHSVLWLATLKKIMHAEITQGVRVKAKTTKSKTPRPFRTCIFTFYFDYGLDNIGTNVDYLFDLISDSGKLSVTACKSISWGGEFPPSTIKQLQEFFDANNFSAQFKEDDVFLQKDTGITKKFDRMLYWIEQHDNALKIYHKQFGKSYKRDELIEILDEDKEQQEHLSKMVSVKWEAREEECKIKRRGKYRNVETDESE